MLPELQKEVQVELILWVDQRRNPDHHNKLGLLASWLSRAWCLGTARQLFCQLTRKRDRQTRLLSSIILFNYTVI